MTRKTIFITGGAKRIGAVTAKYFHERDYNIVLHYNKSEGEAHRLTEELNKLRENSCFKIKADFSSEESISSMIDEFHELSCGLNILINNASSFYPTPLEEASRDQWKNLLDTNTTTPLFLIKAFHEDLIKSKGCVINVSDSLAARGIKNFSLYSSAKAALETLSKSLAKELAPAIRVNVVAPGAILWPEYEKISEDVKNKILSKIDLRRIGNPLDIASAIYFLSEASYITGQVLKVDGGRS